MNLKNESEVIAYIKKLNGTFTIEQLWEIYRFYNAFVKKDSDSADFLGFLDRFLAHNS